MVNLATACGTRTASTVRVDAELGAGTAVAGPFRVNLDRKEIVAFGVTIVASSTEFELLLALLEARGQVLTRVALRERLARSVGTVHKTLQTVDRGIGQLRRKLGISDWFIQTERGVGYRFATLPEWITRSQRQ